jgi:hypothetical protein
MRTGPGTRRVGFAAGLRWLPVGAELMFAGLGPLAGVASLWLLLSLVAVIVPVIGQLILFLFTPLLTAGVLVAFDQVRQGQAPAPLTLFDGWKVPARRAGLLLIGAWSIAGSMLAAGVLVGWMGSQLTQAELEAAMSSPETLAQTLSGISIGGGLLLALLIFSVVLAAIYFAIPLVMFSGWPTMNAMLVSLRAVVVNWAAFAGFGLAFMAVALALGLVLVLLVTVATVALGQFGVIVSQVLFLIATMFVQMLMAGTQYVAFCQVFDWSSQAPDGNEESPEDQFIA